MELSISKNEAYGELALVGSKAESMPLTSLYSIVQLLERASKIDAGLTFYPPGIPNEEEVSYAQLLEGSWVKAAHIKALPAAATSEVILIHFLTHRESITWFWAALIAGFIPAISPPLVHDEARRRKHLRHVQTLLKDPLVLTSQRLIHEFLDLPLKLQPVEQIGLAATNDNNGTESFHDRYRIAENRSKPAVLMLTSGSTGNVKAVSLTHRQILESIQSKTKHHGYQPGGTVLNWIGFDHVASLTETHLTAMALSSDQVQVHATGKQSTESLPIF